MDTLTTLLTEHFLEPKDPNKAYCVAREYDIKGQGAAAVSLYIKAADLTTDKEIQYCSMLYGALCYSRMGNRDYTVLGMLQHAVCTLPKRPEAHYYLCKYYENKHDWQQLLLHALLGYDTAEDELEPVDIGYPGSFCFKYFEAVAHWHISGVQNSKELFFDLKYRIPCDEEFHGYATQKLYEFGFPDTIPYKQEDCGRFRYKFPGLSDIKKNYSKHFQDLFVLAATYGKKNGTYLEIGSGDPFIHNNTALLETEFGWKGLSMDISEHLAYSHKLNRLNPVLCTDATKIDISGMLKTHCFDNHIDYLQIDCDDATVDVLENIPFNEYTFGVVTFEHDSYRLGDAVKTLAREKLASLGYILLVKDVSFSEWHAYEDWYVHPRIIDMRAIVSMKSDLETNFVWNYFIGNPDDS